jgi:hypothetical protein
MLIKVHGEERYIPVSTVTLYSEGNTTYPFHCPNCGNTSNIIGGKVTKMTPIFEPSDQIPVISTCKSCKAKYVFQDSVEPEVTITVVLSRTPEIQSFYCYLGGGDTKFINKILEYNNQTVFSYLDHENIDLPYVTRCANTDCPLTYQFSQLS